MKNVTATVVADKLVELCTKHGDLITHLRLQRLVYYAQAWYLAIHERALFPEAILASDSGPVQPDVAAIYGRFGTEPISRPIHIRTVPEKLNTHLSELLVAYGHLSSLDLELSICDEEPWKAARKKACEETPMPALSTSLMENFYKLRLDG